MREARIEALDDALIAQPAEASLLRAGAALLGWLQPAPDAVRVGKRFAEGGNFGLQVLDAVADALPGYVFAGDRPDENLVVHRQVDDQRLVGAEQPLDLRHRQRLGSRERSVLGKF